MDEQWRPFVDADGNEGKDHAHTLSTDGTDTCTVCGVPLFIGERKTATDFWMADAEYLSVVSGRRRPWLIGEDENAAWWVPCQFRDTPRRDGWRQFQRYNPFDWLHYWNSRIRNQVVFLFG